MTLGGQDFTIDFWVYYDQRSNNTNNHQAMVFNLWGGQGVPRVYAHRTANHSGNDSQITAGVVLDAQYLKNIEGKTNAKSAIARYRRTTKSVIHAMDSWHHVAMVYCHERKVLFIYFDGNLPYGTAGQNGAVDHVINVTIPQHQYVLILGSWPPNKSAMYGMVDELRIQNGIARWLPQNQELFERRPNTEAEGKIFDPPTRAGQFNENDVLHNQITGGYLVELNNNIKEKKLVITEYSGTVRVRNSNPSVATAIFDEDAHTINIRGLSQGESTITIYTDDTDTTYGVVRILDIVCKANVGLSRLDECDPAEIKSTIREGNASKAWSIGDLTKDIKISGTINGQSVDTTVKAVLIGIDHNKDKETAGNFNAHFMISLPITLPMNLNPTNAGGWESSDIRKTFCEQFRNCLPTSWKNMISYCSKATYNMVTGSNTTVSDITVTQDKVFLLSEYEIFGEVLKGNNLEINEQQRYSYFFDVGKRPKTWTRSPSYPNNNSGFVKSNGNTSPISIGASSEEHVAVCFCVTDYEGPINLDAEISDFKAEDITYDGSDHNAVEENIITTIAGTKLNSKYHVWTGEVVGNIVKTYTLYVRPATGYLWADGTDTVKPVTWKIKAPSTENIIASKTDIRLYYANEEETIDIVRNNTSSLEVIVEDPSIVSYEVLTDKVILRPIGLGATTVTITSPASDNYGEGSVTISVKASDISSLSQCTPEEIQRVVLTGYADIAWDVGDNTSDIKLVGFANGQYINTMVKAYILGFDHNSNKEGVKKLHMCLGRTVTGKDTGLISLTLPTTYDGYTGSCTVLKDTCEDFFNCLPLEWQAVISKVTKQVDNVNDSTTVEFNTMWLMAEKEVIGPNDDHYQQYLYYKNANSAVREINDSTISWFTRNSGNANARPITINAVGTSSSGTLTAYVVPCFTIGAALPSPNLIVDKSTVSTIVGGSDTFLVSYDGTGKISAVSSDPSIATVSLSGSIVTVNGVKTGRCYAVITVTATETHTTSTINVPIIIGTVQKTAPKLTLSDSSLTVTKGNTVSCTVNVEGGTLSVRSHDETIATAKLNGNEITIKGINEGDTTVTVIVTGDETHYDDEQDIMVTVSAIPAVRKDIPDPYNTITFKNDMVYNTTMQSVNEHLDGYYSLYHSLGGDIQAKNRNDQEDYVVTVTPRKDYQWKGGGTDSKTVPWNIKQANAEILGSQKLTLVKDKTQSTTITYAINGDGILSVKSNSNPSLVTVTVSDNKVTFTSNCTENGEATIVLQTLATVNYKATTLDITVAVSMTAMQTLPDSHNYSALSVTKAAVTYNAQTVYSINKNNVSDWISKFNSTYHVLSKVTNSDNSVVTNKTASGVTTYTVQDAGTYKIWITPAAGYAWDDTGNTEERSLSWTINRIDLGVITATQTGLSLTKTAMTYNGSSQTPIFDVQDNVTVTVTAQTAAKTYNTDSTKATVTPKPNYCWKGGGTDSKTVAWVIKPAVLTSAQEPKFKADSMTYTLSNKKAVVQKPTVSNFTFNTSFPSSKFTFTAPTTGQSNAGTYNSGNSVAKFKLTDTNYVFDNNSDTKTIPWTISPKKVNKPTLKTAYSKPYTGSAHSSITISNKIATNDALVTDGYVQISAENYLATDYTKSTTGYSTSKNTDINFTPTNAGKYKIIYTLTGNTATVNNVTWTDDSKDQAIISFEVTKATIPANEVPKTPANLTVKYNKGTSITYVEQAPTFATSAKYTYSCKKQTKAGTYSGNTNGALFTPTANYQWLTTTQKDTIAPLAVSWTIDLADGFIDVTYDKIKPKPSALTNNNYETTFTATGSGNITVSIDKAYIATVTKESSSFNVKGLGEGSATITLTAAAVTGYFKTATKTEAVNLSVVHVTMSKSEPWTFMHNFLQHLIWYNCDRKIYVLGKCKQEKNANGVLQWVQDNTVKQFTKYVNIDESIMPALNHAINKTTNGSLKTMQAVVDKMKALATDLAKTLESETNANNTVNQDAKNRNNTKVNTHLKNYYSMDLSNDDCGSIFGKDIGGSSTNVTIADVVKETGQIGAYPSTKTTTMIIPGSDQKLTIVWPEGSATVNNKASANETKMPISDRCKHVVQAINTWWLERPLTMINKYFGLHFGSVFNDINQIYVIFGDDMNYELWDTNGRIKAATLASCGERAYSNYTLYYPIPSNVWEDCQITDTSTYEGNKIKSTYNFYACLDFLHATTLNVKVNRKIVDNKRAKENVYHMALDNDGTIEELGSALDSTIGHELVHGIMNQCLRYHHHYPGWFKESIAELIWGIDKSRTSDIITIVKNATEMQKIFDGNPSSNIYIYTFGVLIFRYLIKNYCK